jgi:hypothetical protein
MPKRGPNKQVTYLFDYFDYNLFGIKLVNALTGHSHANDHGVIIVNRIVSVFTKCSQRTKRTLQLLAIARF